MREEEKLIYGFGETQKIIAIQQISSREMRLYIRENGNVNHIDKRFYPFFYSAEKSFINELTNNPKLKLDGKIWIKKLKGNEYYKYILAFETWSDMYKTLRFISRELNYPDFDPVRMSEIYIVFDPISQFLIQSGETLFKGMNYEDLNILFVKILPIIETQSSFHSKHFDQIFAIALADNKGWQTVLHQKPKAVKESDLLKNFVNIINEKNPDLIVGYEINEELIYLNSRLKLYNLNFSIGRDKTEPLINYEKKSNDYDEERTSSQIIISGRHLVDLMQIVSRSKSIYRDVENFSLTTITKYFDLRKTEELVINEERIPFYADYEPEILIKKVQKEVEDIIALSEIILPQYFYQAQFVPMDFSQIINSGVSKKIEAMMVREYLRNRYSLPKPEPREQISGGYTEVFQRGLFQNIIYADVESLYPSIIIQNEITPSTDKLKIFPKLVKTLTKKRLHFKRLKEKATDPNLKLHYDKIQNAYKVLINSFYGYLGYYRGIFNDYSKANEVTLKGQELLKQLIKEFQKRNCTVIEVDTDGLFVSPLKSLTEEEEIKLVEDVNRSLPDLINLSFGGRYAKMLSYKKKNYALLTYDNKIIIKGSALISRSFEPFALKFLQKVIELILTDRIEQIPKIYLNLRSDILNLNIDIKDFAKTEILHDSYQAYHEAVMNQTRTRNAAYELAYKYYGEKIPPGLKISYYITGDDPNVKVYENCELVEFYNPKFPNINRMYYLKKLEDYVSRFEVFFSKEDFSALFPNEFKLNFQFKPKVINSIIKE
jgi:DNA polymerase elongation subunit (family B)